MSGILATMVTLTTYGTWLRGDERGWTEDGRARDPNPQLMEADQRRLKHPAFVFSDEILRFVGQTIGDSLVGRMSLPIWAMSVHNTHGHILYGPTAHSPAAVVKCAKDAARYALRVGRPLWTEGYDKRYCFDADAVRERIRYIEDHNAELGWARRPWSFVRIPEELAFD
ncbi:MAG: hypothetical protein U0836_00380 [Pirellulales bacterium]